VTTAPGIRRAVVAITLLNRPHGLAFVVLKRVARGLNPGQWALPGGKTEPGETPTETALRELAEETDIRCGPEAVLGTLDDFAATSGFAITPVVVIAPADARPRRNPAEVASIHLIPVARLVAPGVPRWRPTPDGPLLQVPLRHDMVVHAPTGAILWQFAQVALAGTEVRFDNLQEPAFTRA
jgi:8-oxo-dGTP pyrophosphatase MutT (NUDIX family)